MARKARIGRPPRTDNPEPVTIPLPGALARWLRAQARREGRPMGRIVADALTTYKGGKRHGTR